MPGFILEYRKHQGILHEYLASHTSDNLSKSTLHTYLGLQNQGATCYLNCILQALFAYSPLRNVVFAWRYDTEIHGSIENSIPAALQSLFSALSFSTAAYATTTALTRAFQWDTDDAFQQHDISEMMMQLFQALELSGLSCSDLTTGQWQHTLTCSACGDKRANAAAFTTLQVPLAASSAAGTVALTDALAPLCAPETLTDFRCPQCAAVSTTAKQGQALRLPPLLCLHLERFSFDITSGRRCKVRQDVVIPAALQDSQLTGDGDAQGGTHELFAVLVHTGSALAGHYYAYIQPKPGLWLEFNDTMARPLSEPEVAALLSDSAEPPADAAASKVWTARRDAYMLLYQAPQADPPAASPTAAHIVAELQAAEAADLIPQPARIQYTDQLPPEASVRAILAENQEQLNAARLWALKQQITTISLWPASAATSAQHAASESVFKTPAARPALPAASRSESKHASSEDIEQARHAGPALVVDMPAEWTLEDIQKYCQGVLKAWVHDGVWVDEIDTAWQAKPHVVSLPRRDANGALADELAHCLAAPHANLRYSGFHVDTRRATVTYSSTYDVPVEGLGMCPSADLVIETRLPDEEWREWDPTQVVMTAVTAEHLHAALCCDGESADGSAASAVAVTQRALQDLGQSLRTTGQTPITAEAVAAALGSAGEPQPFAHITLPAPAAAAQATDGITVLREPASGPIEHADVSATSVFIRMSGSPDIDEPLLAALRRAASTLMIQYNVLGDTEATHAVFLPATATLADFKAAAAEVLGCEPAEFTVSRSASAPQLKELHATLADLGFVSGSCVSLQAGQQLSAGQFWITVLRMPLQDPDAPAEQLGTLAVSGHVQVKTMRRQVSELWNAAAAAAQGEAGAMPRVEPDRLRLRDKRGATAGEILKDDVKVQAAMPRLADGRELVVQLLPQPEHIGPNDMVVTLRRWWPLRKGKAGMSQPVDIVLSKRCCVDEFRVAIRSGHVSLFGEGQLDHTAVPASTPEEGEPAAEPTCVPEGEPIFEFAKVPTTMRKLAPGPVAKLEWLGVMQLANDDLIARSPFGVRDGVAVLVRERREFELADGAGLLAPRSASRAGSAAAGGAGKPAPKPWQRKGPARPTPREQSVSITVALPASKSTSQSLSVTVSKPSPQAAAPQPDE